MPTRDRGLVWFAIINRGTNVWSLRTEQDQLLQRVVQQLQVPASVPAALTPHSAINSLPQLGAATRNEILFPS
jgi:D-alanyl-D-alanine carboxypeptidase/D-alanyl-D-alanine-endopeptidase (penicillin-binding protein 4)